MEQEFIKELKINDILTLLPHRYPFLLVDKVGIIKKGEEGIGFKNITVNEPQFTGHFPENPIMPGVLIMEAKFRKPFLPGDVMEMHVVKEKECRGVYRFKCQAKCNGVLHAEAILTALMSR